MYTEEIDTISDIRNDSKYRDASVSPDARQAEASKPVRYAVSGRTGAWATAFVGPEVAAA